MYAVVIIVVLFMFRKQLHTVVGEIGAVGDSFLVQLGSAAAEADTDARNDIIKQLNRRNITFDESMSTHELLDLLRGRKSSSTTK